jgi:PST family polysaccharide transporter
MAAPTPIPPDAAPAAGAAAAAGAGVPTIISYAAPRLDPAPVLPVRPQPALGHRAASGLLWMILGTVGTKGVGLLGQVVLSYLLLKEDFGLVAKCAAVATIPGLLAQLGLRQILVRRAKRFDRWIGPAVWMAAAFGTAAAVLLAATAPLAVKFFGPGAASGAAAAAATAADPARHRMLVGMLLLVAASIPPGLVGETLLAKLQIQLRFRLLSVLGFATSLFVIALNVMFAAPPFELGAYSFALPAPIAAVVRLAVVWYLIRPPVTRRPRVRRWRYLVGDSSVVMVSRAAATAISMGDFLVMGRYHPDDVVGLYYFAYNLSTQALMLIAGNLEGVLFPALSQLRDEPARQRQGFISAARMIALVGVPLCVLQAGLAAPGVHAVFAPKWYPAVAALQVLSIGMAFRVASVPAQSLMQAQGRFKALMWANVAGGIVFLAVVLWAARSGGAALAHAVRLWPALGGWLGGDPRAWPAVAVALAVGLYLCVEGPALVYLAVRPAGARWADVGRVFGTPVALSAIAVGTACVVGAFLPVSGRAGDVMRIVVITLLSGAIYLGLARVTVPGVWAEALQRLAAFRRRKAATGATP